MYDSLPSSFSSLSLYCHHLLASTLMSTRAILVRARVEGRGRQRQMSSSSSEGERSAEWPRGDAREKIKKNDTERPVVTVNICSNIHYMFLPLSRLCLNYSTWVGFKLNGVCRYAWVGETARGREGESNLCIVKSLIKVSASLRRSISDSCTSTSETRGCRHHRCESVFRIRANVAHMFGSSLGRVLLLLISERTKIIWYSSTRGSANKTWAGTQQALSQKFKPDADCAACALYSMFLWKSIYSAEIAAQTE